MSGTGRKISSSEQIFRRAGIISERFRYSKIVDLYNLFCTEFNPVSNLKRTRKQAEMPQSLGKATSMTLVFSLLPHVLGPKYE